MSIYTKFFIFQASIILPFIAGKFFSNRKKWDVTTLSKKLIRFNLITLTPFIVLWSIWGIKIKTELLVLPIFAVAIALFGGLIGFALINITRPKYNRVEKTTFLVTSTLANHGFTMGSFLCYIFLGDIGLGYASVFLIYFMPFLFLVIFPYAAYNSNSSTNSMEKFREMFFSMQNLPLYASIAAFTLHYLNIPRPEINLPLDLIIIISVALYYFTLGISFLFTGLKNYIFDNILIVVSKFLIIPLTVYIILNCITLDPVIKKVILIQSFMPAALYSVITSILFDLDSHRATGIFIVNTVIFLTTILPFLFFLNRIISF